MHNRMVLLLTALTVVAVLVLWTLLYVAAQWLTLVFLTVARPMDAELPAGFTTVFVAVAAAVVALAVLERVRRPDRRARDFRSGWAAVIDLILAVPRATVGVCGNLSALLFLNSVEFEEASNFLQRLQMHERMPLHAVPIELTDSARRDRILLSLQLLDLIELRKYDDGVWVFPRPWTRARRPEARQGCAPPDPDPEQE